MDDHGDVRLPALVSALRLGVAIACPPLLVGYALLWGSAAVRPVFGSFKSAGLLLAAAAIGVVVHEFLHAACYRWIAGLPWKSMRFIFVPFIVIAGVEPRVPLSTQAFRVAVAGPGVLLGVVP